MCFLTGTTKGQLISGSNIGVNRLLFKAYIGFGRFIVILHDTSPCSLVKALVPLGQAHNPVSQIHSFAYRTGAMHTKPSKPDSVICLPSIS